MNTKSDTVRWSLGLKWESQLSSPELRKPKQAKQAKQASVIGMVEILIFNMCNVMSLRALELTP